MIGPTWGGQRGEPSAGRERLLAFLTDQAASARLFRSPDNRYYARVAVDGLHEMLRVDSPLFRDWLIDGCHRHQLDTPTKAMIGNVVNSLEMTARRNRRIAPVFLRVGADGDTAASTFFLDLGDPSGRAVVIRADGWSLIEQPLMQFRRPGGLMPLPVPSSNGSIELLRSYANLSESHFRRVVVWMAAALLPCGPHPALIIRGDEGSAKSTLARVIKLLIDPNSQPFVTNHESASDLMSTCLDTWLPVYDNVSTMPAWLSTTLSDLVRSRSVANHSRRSGNDQTMPLATRPLILCGVENGNDHFKASPLCIHVELRPILFDDRRADDEFWASFQADYPRILGEAVLDVLVEGLHLVRSDRRPA